MSDRVKVLLETRRDHLFRAERKREQGNQAEERRALRHAEDVARELVWFTARKLDSTSGPIRMHGWRIQTVSQKPLTGPGVYVAERSTDIRPQDVLSGTQLRRYAVKLEEPTAA